MGPLIRRVWAAAVRPLRPIPSLFERFEFWLAFVFCATTLLMYAYVALLWR